MTLFSEQRPIPRGRPAWRIAGAAVLAALLGAAPPEAGAFQGYQLDIEYDKLLELLGEDAPTGAGVAVSQVEALSGADHYMPNDAASDLAGKIIVNGSIDGDHGDDGVSPHATSVAQQFFGTSRSEAPDVTDITVYETGHYIDEILRYNSGTPTAQNFKVQSHAWVHDVGSTSGNRQVLRRLDWTIDKYDMIAVVGLDNESDTDLPPLLANSYNAIAVGRSDGLHSRGGTDISTYGAGRVKPDIVAPRGSTSNATAVVSSVAAMLHESGAGTSAVNSEPMRAILLAGATKQEFPGWQNSPEQPLDDVYGAGELNALNSYLIQAGGEFDGDLVPPAAPADALGWDYGTSDAVADNYYALVVPEYHEFVELSVALAWNVKVGSGSAWSNSHTLANLDLALYDSAGISLDSMVAQSASDEHNVEHLYLTDLEPGTYTLAVSGSEARDYGLAWRLNSIAPPRASGDFNGDGRVDAADYGVWRDTLGSTTLLEADGDLNGVVDAGDYVVWQSAYSGLGATPSPAAPGAGGLVPEPAAATLLALLAGAAAARRSRRRRTACSA